MKILFLFLAIVWASCVPTLSNLDGGGTELVPGTFYHELLKVTSRYSTNSHINSGYGYDLSHSFCFTLDVLRFIRYIYIDTVGDPVKNLNIYTRISDTDRWTLVKQLKSPVDANTRIDLNVRASEIRVIQKTMSLREESEDIITGFRVYAQSQ